jgi:fatty acid desaturase
VYIVGVMLGHDGSQGGAFRSKNANAALRHIAFPLATGMSGLFWQYKHNVLHHPHPNVIERDEDIEIYPMAQGRAYHIASSPALRTFQRRCQGVLFWLLASELPLDLRKRSIVYLVSHARTRPIDLNYLIDVIMVVTHYLLWIVLPSIWLDPLLVIAYYLYFWTIGGLWLSILGLCGHAGLPLIARFDDPVVLTFHTTRNIKLGPVMSWCFVGLDFQIEHHLFPALPSFQLHKAAPLVRQFAAERNLPYHEETLGSCIVLLTRYFAKAWNDPGHELVDNWLHVVDDEPARLFLGKVRDKGVQRAVRIGGEPR